jgi:hypothetical protein
VFPSLQYAGVLVVEVVDGGGDVVDDPVVLVLDIFNQVILLIESQVELLYFLVPFLVGCAVLHAVAVCVG